MTAPTSPHYHAKSIYGSPTSVRRSAIEGLAPSEGAYDYDTGQPTEFYVVGNLTSGATSLLIRTFNNALERDTYILDDPDGLLS